jgi:RNA polymerase sigma factor (sigma-70 family)
VPNRLRLVECNRAAPVCEVKGVSPPSLAAPGGLSRRLAAGDERAFEECYRSLGPLVLSYLRRFVAADAEDLLQVVFLELWRSRERLEPSQGVEGFVFTVARRRAIDLLRRRTPPAADAGALQGLVGEDGDLLAERYAVACVVRRALGTLSESQRRSLVLAYFEGRTQREIADHLGIPMGTVKARMARGMRRLAETMTRDRS